MEEEHALTDEYRETKLAPTPQGQGLNDLYVRFFCVAECKIVDGTGAGIVCMISNYSWLDGLSHSGMRERYMEVFDQISIDCLNGRQVNKTGKLTPGGDADPSVFSTEQNPEGIQVGTAVALMVRRKLHARTTTVLYRDFWGREKRADLLRSQLLTGSHSYESLSPLARAGFPFMPRHVGSAYMEWPSLPELLPVSFPGVKTSRDYLSSCDSPL